MLYAKGPMNYKQVYKSFNNPPPLRVGPLTRGGPLVVGVWRFIMLIC